MCPRSVCFETSQCLLYKHFLLLSLERDDSLCTAANLNKDCSCSCHSCCPQHVCAVNLVKIQNTRFDKGNVLDNRFLSLSKNFSDLVKTQVSSLSYQFAVFCRKFVFLFFFQSEMILFRTDIPEKDQVNLAHVLGFCAAVFLSIYGSIEGFPTVHRLLTKLGQKDRTTEYHKNRVTLLRDYLNFSVKFKSLCKSVLLNMLFFFKNYFWSTLYGAIPFQFHE